MMHAETSSPASPYMGGPVDVATSARGEISNQRFQQHANQFARKVHSVTKGIWCHVGACLGNSTMIEGASGMIIVDTGDCVEQSLIQKQDFRRVHDKPLSGLIYTHVHYVFGSRTWIPTELEGKVPVWAHPSLMLNMSRMASDLSPFMVRRAAIQFGMHLPNEGPDSSCHQGLGPFFYEFDKYSPTTGFVRPTHQATDGLEAQIDGVRFTFFHAWGDTDDTLLIWMPDSRTVINNIAWPAMFNICTLRGEVYRNPLELLRGLDKILELEPEHLVGVHGLPISGREEIRRCVTEYRDTIQYTYDQTLRGINAGLSPAALVQYVRLPASLANGRLIGEFYGELSYHVRQIYAGMVGWFGNDTVELHPVAPTDQARRLIELAGGEERLAAATRAALEQREYAWAAQMATWLLQGSDGREEYRRLKASALRAMGQVTTAANTRSWYLTQALELEGKVDTSKPLIHFINAAMVRQMPVRTYVNGLRFQLSPSLSEDGQKTVHLQFQCPDANFTLRLRNGVVVIVDSAPSTAVDATIMMAFDSWARLIGGEAAGTALLSSGEIAATGNFAIVNAVLGIDRSC